MGVPLRNLVEFQTIDGPRPASCPDGVHEDHVLVPPHLARQIEKRGSCFENPDAPGQARFGPTEQARYVNAQAFVAEQLVADTDDQYSVFHKT